MCHCTMLMGSVVLVVALPAAWAAERQELAAELQDDRIAVSVDGKLFTAYKFATSQKYPYFWPVNGPVSEKSVTTESSQPYPHHHSLFFGCDKVNGGNYWQDMNARGQIISQGPKIVDASGVRVTFTDECLWERPGMEPVIRDTRQITISAPDDNLRFIDFDITLHMLTDVRIERTNHSLFSARVRPELSVESGGRIVNAEGKENHEGTHGIPSVWCDYSGAWDDGAVEGMAIFQHPENRWYPAPWFTRDYGFFSPTRMNWLDEGHLEFKQGETLRLRYRVVVHTGDAAAADIAGLWQQYEQGAEQPKAEGS